MGTSTSRVDIKKFDGTIDFWLWKIKTLAHLGNLGFDKTLGDELKLPATMEGGKKKELLKKAFKVLSKVTNEKSASEVWLKLETLYMTKNLSNRLYLKAKFLTFKMAKGRDLQAHIDNINKLYLDLESIEVKYKDEDKALVLLHSLPKSYETFVDILKHGRDTISLVNVMRPLNSKEHQQRVTYICSLVIA